MLNTDWWITRHEVIDAKSHIPHLRLTLWLHRMQYKGSERKGLDRLLVYVEGVLRGAFGINLTDDGDPVIERSPTI